MNYEIKYVLKKAVEKKRSFSQLFSVLFVDI